jgi:squalene-hopene/tetraprenyl-beta-curcumene cyclase
MANRSRVSISLMSPLLPTMKPILPLAASLAVLVHPLAAQESLIPRDQTNLSLRNEVGAAIQRGLGWLEKQQDPAGFWSVKDHPAVTALVASAYLGSPGASSSGSPSPHIQRALAWVAGNAREDGGIYVDELRNYNTAVSLLALHLSADPKYRPIVEKARAYTVSMQAKGLPNPALNGGIGYGPGGTSRQHPDLSNTLLALEALAATREFEKGEKAPPEQKLDWQAAINFITRTQNLPSHNKAEWVSDTAENFGGFVYYPGYSMAGEIELGEGRKALRSYGSMSYAGLLSMIYAQVDRNDDRVKGVLTWLQRHYTLKENPGMGNDGLYYYYQVMAKGLGATGLKELALADGTKVDWRTELAKHLINLQKPEGFWVNESGRWWEKDPVLVTTYSVLALNAVYQAL